MSFIPTNPTQLTTDWLTETLRSHGHLSQGAVTAVEQMAVTSSYVATHIRLSLGYSSDAPANSPVHLFVKLSQEHPELGPKEVEFYSRVAPRMAEAMPTTALPFVTCYGSGYHPESLRAFLLLKDLSDSHIPGERPLPPVALHCEQIVEGLAHLHAFWWEHPLLDDLSGLPTQASVERLIADAQKNLSDFVEVQADRLSIERRATLEHTCSGWSLRRKERTLAGTGLTLVHRDAHTGNFLYPRNSSHCVQMIDWDAWRVQMGTDDLAYFMAAHWYPDLRTRWEMALLRRYHAGLSSRGVENYTWDDCLMDYRESIIRTLFTFVGGYRKGRPPALWWERVEKLLIAHDEWHCAELLYS